MKKALGQTVRDLKRGVNRNVLKVPSIEQKVLDATSNEPWGPHGSVLADIAMATRNYHEYQMIMSVIWKRINDTGKNWRHVYKALTVLEYLVGHGAERVIDDIREHAYQISTLSDFQYIDSRGRDQGNNVRKKSQSLVVLVNDKERIQEVREKAAANREKYRNTSGGSMYRPASGGYLDKYDYESRDEGRNGYGDSYGRDGYRDDDFRGRSPNTNDYQYGSRSRSADRDRERADEDDGQYSSRGSGAKADDHSQDGSTTSKGLERRFSEQNLSAPPSYEDAIGAAARSPTFSERNGESPVTSAPKAPSPTHASPSHANVAAPPNIPASSPLPASAAGEISQKQEDDFDEFDPRGSFSAAPTIQNGTAPATSGFGEMDLLGSLSESFSSNSLALVLAEPTITSETNVPVDFGSGPTFAAAPSTSTIPSQPFDDPFGDSPFKAMPSGLENVHPPTNPQFTQHEISTPNHEIDILADILPPAAPSSFGNTQIDYPVPSTQSFPHAQFPPQTNDLYPTGHNAQENNFQHSLHASYPLQSSELVPQTGFMSQPNASTFPIQAAHMGVQSQSGQAQAGFSSQMGFGGPPAQPNPNPNFYGVYHQLQQNNFLSQSAPQASQIAPPAPQVQSNFTMAPQVSTMPDLSLAIVPQPSNDKFETKSTVWADTLSRGLVNLNISGSKTNPLANIGVDFDAINRREKRMEKSTTTTSTSTISMGKAMGSGSGMGRAGAGAMRPQQNQMMGPGMNYGPPGMNMGGYGANQPMGNGMGPNMAGSMGMGMGQGAQMQQQVRFPPGQAQNMPGAYNPMMGSGNYGQQQYGAGYR